MRILILNWRDLRHPRAGGAEVRLHEIYSRLVENGHEVTLIASGFPGGLSEEWVTGLRVLRRGTDVTHLYCAWKELRQQIKQVHYDVVVEDLNKLPYLSPLFHSRPRWIQMHHLWGASIFRESSKLAALVVWASEKCIPLFYRKTEFCVVSPSTRRELAELGIAQNRIQVIYNGTFLSRYCPDPSVQREKRVLWLSRVQKYKGILDAVAGFKIFAERNPTYKMWIAGSGPFAPEVKALVAKDPFLAERVEFLGFVDEDTKLRLYRSCAFLLQTSYKEGWGLTVLEANACGTPVIAQAAPGLVDSVLDGQTGLLYPMGDLGAMAECMERLIQSNAYWTQLSLGGLEWAASLTWEKAAFETEAALQKVVGV